MYKLSVLASIAAAVDHTPVQNNYASQTPTRIIIMIRVRLTEIDKGCRVSARIFPAGLEKVLVNEFLIGNGNP